MWQSERQQCQVIQRLLAPHPAIAGLWTSKGPTKLACTYLDHGAPLSSGEMLLLRVAFDIWNSRGKARVDELLCTLDERNLRAVCEALLARDVG
jgi:hypothetical protein